MLAQPFRCWQVKRSVFISVHLDSIEFQEKRGSLHDDIIIRRNIFFFCGERVERVRPEGKKVKASAFSYS